MPRGARFAKSAVWWSLANASRAPEPPENALHGDHREERLHQGPGRCRGAPVPRQHGHDGVEDADERRAREPELAEGGIVEPDRESPEVVVAAAHGALVAGEGPRRHVACAQPGVDGLRRFETSLHG